MSDCCGGLLKERSSETVVIVSDGLLAQTLRTACVRSAHILLVEFRFHMGYSLLLEFGWLGLDLLELGWFVGFAVRRRLWKC